jgi:antitoxin HigA-1
MRSPRPSPSHPFASQITRGQRTITADTALRLSRYFGTRADWWLDLQSHYDLELATDKLEARVNRAIKPRLMKSVA